MAGLITIAPRTPVPSVKALVQEHNVARGTAERAVEVLRSEGLVRTVPGKGVFVLLPEERGR
jgi:GntR family transcriptional regulator